jgi:hypothetical protein
MQIKRSSGCGELYIIECREIVDLYEEKELAARADSITVIANEYDPFDWHGSMTFGKGTAETRKLSSHKGRVLTVTFNRDDKNYMGLIRIVEDPRDMGPFYWVEFSGVDLLQAK